MRYIGRPIPLGQAFAEYGRIAKTQHLQRRPDEGAEIIARYVPFHARAARTDCRRLLLLMDGSPLASTRRATPLPSCA
ncbi:hypothetical protein ABZS88_34650 [Streptomyces sp. NPDC005480]|uniref:hypothetical protein n=1 Tax=Streptomyces sp. NPDC005480 TaxID=3154880 RepID=UPI0033A4A11C